MDLMRECRLLTSSAVDIFWTMDEHWKIRILKEKLCEPFGPLRTYMEKTENLLNSSDFDERAPR